MADPWLTVVFASMAVASVGLTVLLLWRGVRTAATWMLALVVLHLGYNAALFALSDILDPFTFSTLSIIPWGLLFSGFLGFALVYPSRPLTPVRRAALVVIFLPVVGVPVLHLADPTLFLMPDGRLTTAFMLVGTLLLAAAYLGGTLLLGRRWLAAEPGPHRDQVLWGLLPFLFWTIHDTVGFMVLPLVLGPQPGPYGAVPPHPATAVLGVLGLTVALGFSLLALGRARQEGRWRDVRALFFVVVYGIPLSLIQIFGAAHHFALDGLFVVLLAYGVARHQLFDIDLKVKWTLKQSTVAAAFIAVFLVATEGAQVLFGADNPWLGIGAAALLVFALAPLQRLAERVSDAAMPRVQDTEAYRTVRKHEVYRAALESAAADGEVTDKERDVLATLQEQLGIAPTEALAMEREALTGAKEVT